MPRPSNAENRRRQIVDSLMHVMASTGYEGATIPTIAAHAGLAPGLVHYYFASKQEILLALIEKLVDKARTRFQAYCSGGTAGACDAPPPRHPNGSADPPQPRDSGGSADAPQARESRLNARDELHAFIDAYLAVDEESAAAVACWIAIGAEAVRQSEVACAYQSAVQQQIQALEGIVDRTLSTEGRSRHNKRGVALGIVSAIEGAYRLVVAAPAMLEPGFAGPVIKHMAEGAIEAEPNQ